MLSQFPPYSSESSKAAYTDFLLGLEIINQQEYIDRKFAPTTYEQEHDREGVIPRMLKEWDMHSEPPHLTHLSCYDLAKKERHIRKGLNKRHGPAAVPPRPRSCIARQPLDVHHKS